MYSPVSSEAAILQALIARPSYGLEIIERVEDQTRGAIKLDQGSVYPALRKLEREGLLESYDGESMAERGGRPRRYYRVTAEGRRAAVRNQKSVLALFGTPGMKGV